MRNAAQGAAQYGERLGHLPGQAHVHGNRSDSPGDVDGQPTPDPLFCKLADLAQEIAVAAVDFRLLSHLKELLRPRISLGVNTVTDARDKLVLGGPFFAGGVGAVS